MLALAAPLLQPVGFRGMSAGEMRAALKMTQPQFARLTSVSVRTIASIEQGSDPGEALNRRLVEIARLMDALSEVVSVESIGPWLTKPNPAFDQLKPLEVIERGETDRLWQMIYELRTGSPS